MKATLKKAFRKAMLESGCYKNIKVWDVTFDKDYTGKTWINIEISADKKNQKSKQ